MMGNSHLVEIGVGKLCAGMASLDTSAVDEDTNLMAIGEHLGCQRGDVLLNRNIGRVDPSLAPKLLHSVLGLCRSSVSL